MTTEGNFPLRQLCLKPSLYGRFSLDHLWPLLGDHRGSDHPFTKNDHHLRSLCGFAPEIQPYEYKKIEIFNAHPFCCNRLPTVIFPPDVPRLCCTEADSGCA